MNLKQLQYFLKLAETEHYRKAAEALFITEPSLKPCRSGNGKRAGNPAL